MSRRDRQRLWQFIRGVGLFVIAFTMVYSLNAFPLAVRDQYLGADTTAFAWVIGFGLAFVGGGMSIVFAIFPMEWK